jgi:hypothetical protein
LSVLGGLRIEGRDAEPIKSANARDNAAPISGGIERPDP